jgi:hypothetical protein
MESEGLEQRHANKIYIRLATQLANSKQFENHELMKLMHDEGMIKKFRDFTNSIASLNEFNHDKIHFTTIADKGGEVPAVKIPFKTAIDPKKLNEFKESVNWFYDKNLRENQNNEIILDDNSLTFLFNGNAETQLSKYSNILSFTKTRFSYLQRKEREI